MKVRRFLHAFRHVLRALFSGREVDSAQVASTSKVRDTETLSDSASDFIRHTILCSSSFDLDTEVSGGVPHEAANSRDDVMEERAWEAFCLLCFFSDVLVTNAKVSKEDLRRRFDLFAHGTWEILVDEAVATWRRSQDWKAR